MEGKHSVAPKESGNKGGMVILSIPVFRYKDIWQVGGNLKVSLAQLFFGYFQSLCSLSSSFCKQVQSQTDSAAL